MANREPTIDDLFIRCAQFTEKMKEYMGGKNFSEKFATAMLNATDPDAQFKADVAVKISYVMNIMEMLVNYVNKPITKEGMLQRKLDGNVMLDDKPIPEGALVEYWKDNKWNLGKIVQDKQTKQPQIIDPVSKKVSIAKIEQLKARTR